MHKSVLHAMAAEAAKTFLHFKRIKCIIKRQRMKCNCSFFFLSVFFVAINKVHACIISKKHSLKFYIPFSFPNWTMALQIIIAKICNDTHHIANQSEMEFVLRTGEKTSNIHSGAFLKSALKNMTWKRMETVVPSQRSAFGLETFQFFRANYSETSEIIRSFVSIKKAFKLLFWSFSQLAPFCCILDWRS